MPAKSLTNLVKALPFGLRGSNPEPTLRKSSSFFTSFPRSYDSDSEDEEEIEETYDDASLYYTDSTSDSTVYENCPPIILGELPVATAKYSSDWYEDDLEECKEGHATCEFQEVCSIFFYLLSLNCSLTSLALLLRFLIYSSTLLWMKQ